MRIIRDEGRIGRYKLSKKLGLGTGTTRTLIAHLQKNNLIKPIPKKGHLLTEKGKKFVEYINSKIIDIKETELGDLTVGDCDVICHIKNASDKITNGVKQRDSAFKVGALGVTTIKYEKNRLLIPPSDFDLEESKPKIFKKLISLFKNIEEKDVLIIGTSSNYVKAGEGAIAAALTFIENNT